MCLALWTSSDDSQFAFVQLVTFVMTELFCVGSIVGKSILCNGTLWYAINKNSQTHAKLQYYGQIWVLGF